MAIVEIKEIRDSPKGKIVTIDLEIIDPMGETDSKTVTLKYDRASYEQWYDLWVSKRKPKYVSCSITEHGYDLGITDASFLAGK